MRPQGLSGFGTMADQLEDLGWNDMAPADEPDAHHGPRPVLTPMDTATETTTVLRQREALREESEAPAPERAPPAEPVADEGSGSASGRDSGWQEVYLTGGGVLVKTKKATT